LTERTDSKPRIVILGAGPAGLGAAHELVRHGAVPTVVERHDKVGGLARTETFKGHRFDLGGHRFFTHYPEVERSWHRILGRDFLLRPRLSRIFYRGRFFAYRLRPLGALRGLGLVEAVRVLLSYLRWHLRPYPKETTFEHWVTNRFGRRLFRTFFESYTEKVWGIPCSELRAEWAAQRIKDLSLRVAVLRMLGRRRADDVRSLIEQFHYPRLGPGMMWEAVCDEVERSGGTVYLDSEVIRVCHRDGRIRRLIVAGPSGTRVVEGDSFISSIPITDLVKRMDPPAPRQVREAAAALRHRDFITVCLIVERAVLFPDNWIYVHDPQVRVARVQNFKNWSADMVSDPRLSCLGLEYFCNRGDDLWRTSDEELIALARRESAQIGLAPREAIIDGCVVRVEQAYPVYDRSYAEHLSTLRQHVETFDNLRTIGRNGLHRYDNQDHAMLTGILAARDVALGEVHDLWSINRSAHYQEELRDSGDAAPEATQPEFLPCAFPRLHGLAFAVATGVVCGLGALVVSVYLSQAPDTGLARLVSLLGQYYPGYRLGITGSLIGGLYGLASGFAFGWCFAVSRNALLLLSLRSALRRGEAPVLGRLLDYL